MQVENMAPISDSRRYSGISRHALWMFANMLVCVSSSCGGATADTSTTDKVAALLTVATVSDSKKFSAAQRYFVELKDHEVMPLLIEALKQEDPRVRYLSLLGLSSLKDPASVDTLIAYLGEHRFPDIERKVMVEKTVTEAQGEYEVFCLMQAVRTLGELGDKRATVAIASLLGVKELQGAPEEAYLKIAGLKSVMDHQPKNIHEADAIANALVRTKDPKEIPRLMAIVADRNIREEVRQGAVAGLGNLGAKEATDLLLRLARDKNENSLIRASSYANLVKMDTERFLPILEIELPAEQDSLVRTAAVRDLGYFRIARATQLLATMLDDTEEEVRYTAADALVACSEMKYEAEIAQDRVVLRWPPSEKLFPDGKSIVLTGHIAKEAKSNIEYSRRFKR